MPSSQDSYWEKRRRELLAQMERDEERLNAKLSKRYDAEAAKLKHEIAAYYARFGKETTDRKSVV